MALKKFLKNSKALQQQQEAEMVKLQMKLKHSKSGHAGEEGEGWLVSYADMMTLLCGFFIMLFSMSKLDDPKYEKVKEEVAKQFGGKYKSPTQEMGRFMTQIIQDAGVEKQTLIKVDGYGVTIVFESTVFFDTLSADVKTEGQAALLKVIDGLEIQQKKENKQFKVVVEGHTDGRPILAGVFPSNWELSGARSSRVVRMFLDKGYNPSLLTSIGYADTRPIAPARMPDGSWNETALAKNRRVVLRILEPKVDAIPFPDAPEKAEEQAANPTQANPSLVADQMPAINPSQASTNATTPEAAPAQTAATLPQTPANAQPPGGRAPASIPVTTPAKSP